jgi:hypothetical protein
MRGSYLSAVFAGHKNREAISNHDDANPVDLSRQRGIRRSIASRFFEHPGAVNLRQPERLGRQVACRSKALSIPPDSIRVVTYVLTEIE